MQKPRRGGWFGNADELASLVEQPNGWNSRQSAIRHLGGPDIPPVCGPLDAIVGQYDRRQVRQHAAERHNRSDGGVAAAFGDVERYRVSEREAGAANAPQS